MTQADPHKRVLIISHNPLSDTNNNGKTLASFFQDWPREKLAQFYLSMEPPSFTVCGSFYRLTDFEVLRAFLTGRPAVGTVYAVPADDQDTPPLPSDPTGAMGGGERRLRGMLRGVFASRLPMAEWARDMIWRPRCYQSPAFLRWLREFDPEVVFFQGSNYPFAYDVVHWVCAHCGARLLLQLTDDYTFVTHPLLPLSWLHHGRYMRRLRWALTAADRAYAISPAMQEEYARRFGCTSIGVAANCVAIPPYTAEPEADGAQGLRLLYAGGVYIQRWRSLRLLGECLQTLRAEGYRAQLDIYTPRPLTDALRQRLTLEPVMRCGGSLNPAQLAQKMAQANVLVMAEAFSRAARKVTRLSLSTKIPEYMAAGRCILAFGPPDVSSIRYIRSHDAGVVIDSTRREAVLVELRALFDAERRQAAVRNALRVAEQHHQQAVLRQQMYADIQGEHGEAQ